MNTLHRPCSDIDFTLRHYEKYQRINNGTTLIQQLVFYRNGIVCDELLFGIVMYYVCMYCFLTQNSVK